jgi:hypothetical protein
MAARKKQDRIPAKELREYLKLPVDQALSRRVDEVRILPDGRVLWIIPATRIARTWPSREAYEEHLRKFAEYAAKVSVDPCLTLLPPIDDFLRDVEVHAKSLGPRLKIPAEVLDFTPESLDGVDKALKKIPWAKRQVPDLVTPLVAYLGEVMRKGTGAQWSTSTAPGHENEPMITTPSGNLFQPFASVYLPMVEPSRRIPLRSSPGVPYRRPSKPAA